MKRKWEFVETLPEGVNLWRRQGLRGDEWGLAPIPEGKRGRRTPLFAIARSREAAVKAAPGIARYWRQE